MAAADSGYGAGVLLRVNGHIHELEITADELLIDTVRERLGLTGAKQPCGMGNCGACTVLLDDAPVYSCLVLTVECDEHTIRTVEGLADGDRLDPVQEAFVAADALQCGFCTPGQVLSVRALLDEVPDPTDDDVAHALTGNLCRCGAYRHILAAAHLAARGATERGAAGGQ